MCPLSRTKTLSKSQIVRRRSIVTSSKSMQCRGQQGAALRHSRAMTRSVDSENSFRMVCVCSPLRPSVSALSGIAMGRTHNQLIGLEISRRRRFIEEEDSRRAKESASHANKLPLTSREVGSLRHGLSRSIPNRTMLDAKREALTPSATSASRFQKTERFVPASWSSGLSVSLMR